MKERAKFGTNKMCEFGTYLALIELEKEESEKMLRDKQRLIKRLAYRETVALINDMKGIGWPFDDTDISEEMSNLTEDERAIFEKSIVEIINFLERFYKP